jgi:hypothetical protein
MTNEEIQFIVKTTRLVAERIQAAGEIYSGRLYAEAMLEDELSFDVITSALRSLKSGGLVTEGPDHLLRWQGIKEKIR